MGEAPTGMHRHALVLPPVRADQPWEGAPPRALAPQRTLFASAPLLVRARGAFGGLTGVGRRSGRRASSLPTILRSEKNYGKFRKAPPAVRCHTRPDRGTYAARTATTTRAWEAYVWRSDAPGRRGGSSERPRGVAAGKVETVESTPSGSRPIAASTRYPQLTNGAPARSRCGGLAA